MEKRNYKDLAVWQRAVALVPKVYAVVRRLPVEERYALADQMRRAAVSVPANIAEGQARQHRKEFLQHLAIAKGSLAELHTLLIIAQQLGYLSTEDLDGFEKLLAAVRRPLNGLAASLSPTTQNLQPTT